MLKKCCASLIVGAVAILGLVTFSDAAIRKQKVFQLFLISFEIVTKEFANWEHKMCVLLLFRKCTKTQKNPVPNPKRIIISSPLHLYNNVNFNRMTK